MCFPGSGPRDGRKKTRLFGGFAWCENALARHGNNDGNNNCYGALHEVHAFKVTEIWRGFKPCEIPAENGLILGLRLVLVNLSAFCEMHGEPYLLMLLSVV
jgi:hypothetical protein